MIKTITPGIRLEYLPNPRCYIWHISTVGQKAIDAWCDHLETHIPTHGREEPFRGLFILSKYITLTPYLHQKSSQLSRQYKTYFYGRCAFVITRDPSQGAMLIFCKRELPTLWPQVAFDTFYERENALTWVGEELLPPG